MSGNSIQISSPGDITSVISAHMGWKRRIQAEIDGNSDDTLSIPTTMQDNLCALGKWIYSDAGNILAQDTDFIQLKTLHARFHEVTGSTVEMAQRGQKDEAQEIISTGEFSALSRQVVQLLTILYKRYK